MAQKHLARPAAPVDPLGGPLVAVGVMADTDSGSCTGLGHGRARSRPAHRLPWLPPPPSATSRLLQNPQTKGGRGAPRAGRSLSEGVRTDASGSARSLPRPPPRPSLPALIPKSQLGLCFSSSIGGGRRALGWPPPPLSQGQQTSCEEGSMGTASSRAQRSGAVTPTHPPSLPRARGWETQASPRGRVWATCSEPNPQSGGQGGCPTVALPTRSSTHREGGLAVPNRTGRGVRPARGAGGAQAEEPRSGSGPPLCLPGHPSRLPRAAERPHSQDGLSRGPPARGWALLDALGRRNAPSPHPASCRGTLSRAWAPHPGAFSGKWSWVWGGTPGGC